MATGYWTDFCCPKCGSEMFGESNVDGVLVVHCSGNERWNCSYSAPRSQDNVHFKRFVNQEVEVADDVEMALAAVKAGNAGSWKTVAAVLAEEVIRLRAAKDVRDAQETNRERFRVRITPLLDQSADQKPPC